MLDCIWKYINQIRKIYVRIVKRYSKCNHEGSKSMLLINYDYLYSKTKGSPEPVSLTWSFIMFNQVYISYPWYFDPLIHGILTPYPWYFDPPTHGISNPLLWYYEPLSLGRNEGGQFTMRGFKIQWQKIDPEVKILTLGSIYHMKIDPGVKISWGVKIPHDTGFLHQ